MGTLSFEAVEPSVLSCRVLLFAPACAAPAQRNLPDRVPVSSHGVTATCRVPHPNPKGLEHTTTRDCVPTRPQCPGRDRPARIPSFAGGCVPGVAAEALDFAGAVVGASGPCKDRRGGKGQGRQGVCKD